jgi:hypothetical protein
MMGRRLLHRIYASSWLVPVLSVIAVTSLAASAWAVFGVLEADAQRNQDRIDSDLAACSRTNALRVQIHDIGDANEELVRGIVDIVLPADLTNGERAARVAEIRAQFEPLFAHHRDAVDAIRIVDCRAVVPGAPPQPLEGS